MGSSLTLAHFDVDDFKAVNDALGHAAGDAVLVVVAETLQASRAVDIAARVGGDEFVLMLPDARSDRGLHAVERIVRALDNAMAAHDWHVTFSVGAATFHTPDRSIDEMIAIADALMYEAKEAGKSRVCHREISERTP